MNTFVDVEQTGNDMIAEKVVNVFAAIVVVSGLAVAVSSPNMVGIIRSLMDGFAGAINAAQKV
jgi:hypothetical protein